MKQEPAAFASLGRRPFLVCLLTLSLVLGFFFSRSFQPDQALFSNDGPLGINHTSALSLPQLFSGAWLDVYWLGMNQGSAAPDITYLLFWVLGPIYLAKFYAPIALLLSGLAGWLFFRTLKFSLTASLLGALAVVLNSNYFSNACWGLPSRSLLLTGTFLALTALVHTEGAKGWICAILGGFAVGLGIMEAADIGAIFSLYVAAFVIFLAFARIPSIPGRFAHGPLRVGVVAICAALFAAHALTTLVGTQIQGVSGMQQDAASRAARWDGATQWSLPKLETFRVIVPGLFGYRTAEGEGSQYWGTVGRQPGWEEVHQGFARHSGAGEYAGLIVLLIAIWAAAQSFARKSSPYTPEQTKMIWFWSGAALVSLLFAFGRHAPFYQIVYAFPYFSTIRNPIKYMHAFHLALLILFGFGLHGISRRYLEAVRPVGRAGITETLKRWWRGRDSFEKKWSWGSIVALGASVVGWLIYNSSQRDLVAYLGKNEFNPKTAEEIAQFSFGEVGFFVFFFAILLFFLCLIFARVFSRERAIWATVILGLILVLDLGRADTPWIRYYDYKEKYASNPVLDFLKDKPHEHRVAAKIAPLRGMVLADPKDRILPPMVFDWVQNQFPYFDIQVLDVPQWPRMPELDSRMMSTFDIAGSETRVPLAARLWKLTNTRYLLASSGYLQALNQQFDPIDKSFKLRTAFSFGARPGVNQVTRLEDLTLQISEQGPYGIFELTSALPRAKMFGRWRGGASDDETLTNLADLKFNIAEEVFVAEPVKSPAATNSPGTVSITQYQPKRIELQCEATAENILLLNDRYDPAWKVLIDGHGAELLRCNYIMRGVAVPAGAHRVTFVFQPKILGLYISLAAIGAGIVLVGYLLFLGRSRQVVTTKSS